ncbi:MAG: ornithine cyclodeaminase family protein [Alphaproteobacteria bacterium]|nr:ornithine cyclodeaminase family protein [Alphaproteobacteria bacterium]
MADIVVPDTFLWITEAEICDLIDLSGSAQALEKGLVAEAEGKARNMTKTQTVWDVGSLNVTGAQFTGDGLVGAKVWSNANLGAAPIIVMHNANDGQIVAILEAFALGQMRTASLSSVATKWCARRDADEMAIMGSGHQALPQVAAIAAVRDLKRVRVWSRTPANRDSFCDELKEAFDFEIIPCDSVEDAAKDCPIITTFTRAKEPFLFADQVSPGTHINAGGAIIPTNAEIDQTVLDRCDKIVCDNLAQVQKGSRELMEYAARAGGWDAVTPICDLVADQKPRPEGADITIYKFMGMGLADMASAVEILKRARAEGVGTEYPHPHRSKPRLT